MRFPRRFNSLGLKPEIVAVGNDNGSEIVGARFLGLPVYNGENFIAEAIHRFSTRTLRTSS